MKHYTRYLEEKLLIKRRISKGAKRKKIDIEISMYKLLHFL